LLSALRISVNLQNKYSVFLSLSRLGSSTLRICSSDICTETAILLCIWPYAKGVSFSSWVLRINSMDVNIIPHMYLFRCLAWYRQSDGRGASGERRAPDYPEQQSSHFPEGPNSSLCLFSLSLALSPPPFSHSFSILHSFADAPSGGRTRQSRGDRADPQWYPLSSRA
jgi:hypothetical protein